MGVRLLSLNLCVVDMEGKRGKLCAALEHANRCGFNNCDRIDGACGKTKRIIKHVANCYWRERGGCPICSEVFGTVCWHAKTCSDARCTVPYCQTIRRCLVREIIRERAS